MGKRVLFVGIMVVTLSSVSSAGMMDWYYSFFPPQQNVCSNQQQAVCVDMTQATCKVGPGVACNTNSLSDYNAAQCTTTPGTKQTQSVSFSGNQNSFIMGGCGSAGSAYQNISVQTYQNQSLH
jgi:hypothetical protein